MAKATKLLTQILDRALAQELIASNPAHTLPRPRIVSRRPRPATPEQIEAIREWFLNRDRLGDATLVSLLAYVGPRPMEALALHFSDIEGDRLIIERALTNGELKSTKTGRRRVAELPGPVVQDLRLWRIAKGRIDGLICRARLTVRLGAKPTGITGVVAGSTGPLSLLGSMILSRTTCGIPPLR